MEAKRTEKSSDTVARRSDSGGQICVAFCVAYLCNCGKNSDCNVNLGTIISTADMKNARMLTDFQ